MNAVYTDIVVHFLVDDDRSQTERACEIIESGDIFVCTTVLLEVEWVLRSVYKLAAAEISTALKLFCGLPRVVLQNESALRRALIWMDGGLDFADALHLAICADHGAFVTFDKALVRKAKRLGAGKPRSIRRVLDTPDAGRPRRFPHPRST